MKITKRELRLLKIAQIEIDKLDRINIKLKEEIKDYFKTKYELKQACENKKINIGLGVKLKQLEEQLIESSK